MAIAKLKRPPHSNHNGRKKICQIKKNAYFENSISSNIRHQTMHLKVYWSKKLHYVFRHIDEQFSVTKEIMNTLLRKKKILKLTGSRKFTLGSSLQKFRETDTFI